MAVPKGASRWGSRERGWRRRPVLGVLSLGPCKFKGTELRGEERALEGA